jgi:hypothetical protein
MFNTNFKILNSNFNIYKGHFNHILPINLQPKNYKGQGYPQNKNLNPAGISPLGCLGIKNTYNNKNITNSFIN